MSKLFNNIPKQLIINIFEYDNTFHIVYKELLKEFIEKTNFWRLKWINKDINYGGNINEIINIKYFDSHYKKLDFYLHYWNHVYPRKYIYLTNYNCDREFITDNIISSKYIIKKLNKFRI
jgi:hypothetical protein